MGGSRGVSRPQRNARSGVSYRESDDDDFSPNAKSVMDSASRRSSLRSSVAEEVGVAKGKRTLTLKKTRTQERSTQVGQEATNVEEMAEASSEEKLGVSVNLHSKFGQVESHRNVPNLRRESSAFEYLLEAVSGASGDGHGDVEGEDAPTGRRLSADITAEQFESRIEQEGETSADADDPELKCVDEVKKETEENDISRRIAKDSDEEIRKANLIGSKRMEDMVNAKVGKKDEEDSVSSASEEEEGHDEDEDDSWDGSSDDSDIENKISLKNRNIVVAPANKSSKSLKTFEKRINVPKKDVEKTRNILRPTAKSATASKNLQPLLPKKRPALWAGTKNGSSSVGTPLNLSSPSIAHRRVVGLSKRHRPPPLHPYLLGS